MLHLRDVAVRVAADQVISAHHSFQPKSSRIKKKLEAERSVRAGAALGKESSSVRTSRVVSANCC